VPSAQLTPIQMDLASLASVDAAAKKVLAMTSRLDILMNNAGIMAVPSQITVDGYEIQFGTNYLGHALLTKLLLPTMLETAKESQSDVRIVTLTSHSHTRAPVGGIQFQSLRSGDSSSTPLQKYGQSKLANILHATELARRYPNIKTVAVHPGMVQTGLTTTMQKSFILARFIVPVVSHFNAVGVEQGALNQLWAATDPAVESGEYYEPIGVSGLGSVLSRDTTLAEKLWAWTEDEIIGFVPQTGLRPSIAF
jgi:retinol dehydrogenase 12